MSLDELAANGIATNTDLWHELKHLVETYNLQTEAVHLHINGSRCRIRLQTLFPYILKASEVLFFDRLGRTSRWEGWAEDTDIIYFDGQT